MKIIYLLLFISLNCFVLAQDGKDLQVKLDDNTGTIDLIDKRSNKTVTHNFVFKFLELDIYDQDGEYTGSLQLKDFSLPMNEIDKDEKVRIASIVFTRRPDDKEIKLSNIDFVK